jgi:hypothetical protein
MEPEKCQFCSNELPSCDCEFELAIEGLASVYGCGCDGLCFQHAAAAIDEEGETEGRERDVLFLYISGRAPSQKKIAQGGRGGGEGRKRAKK